MYATSREHTGVPSLVPILGIPISAADTLVLTKNQALMVYRLALAYGAPPEFQKRMMEITPVIGAAVMWRQVAGGLVGLIPGYGILPKTAVAYAGTYITGRVAELWYETSFVSKADLRRFRAEATAKARGVKRAIPLFQARKLCPDLVILPSDYETYSIYSQRMFEIMRRFTPLVENR